MLHDACLNLCHQLPPPTRGAKCVAVGIPPRCLQAKRLGRSSKFDDLGILEKLGDAKFLNKVHDDYVKWCKDIEVHLRTRLGKWQLCTCVVHVCSFMLWAFHPLPRFNGSAVVYRACTHLNSACPWALRWPLCCASPFSPTHSA